MILGIQDGVGADRNREVEVPADLRAEKTGWSNADHFERAAVEVDFRAQHRRLAAEFALPERIADHRARRGAVAHVVGCGKHATQQRLHAQHGKKVAAHKQAVLREAVLAALGKIEGSAVPRHYSGKAFLPLADKLPQRIGQFGAPPVEIAGARLAHHVADFRQRFGVAHRQSAEIQRVQQPKDRGVGADAQPQGEHSDGGEAGILTQYAQAVTRVLPELIEPGACAYLPHLLFDLFGAA